jgi:hypothetical protein
MRISSNGFVGIGTSNQTNIMHIANGDNSIVRMGPNTTWGGSLYIGAGNGATNFPVAPSNAGIWVDDGTMFMYSGSGTAGDAYMRFYTLNIQTWNGSTVGANPALFIANNGNVGIGTSSLSAGLQVVGGAKVNGNITGTGAAQNVAFEVNGPSTGSDGAWIAGSFGGTSTANPRVVIGTISSKATIGAHSGALNAWADLYLNQSVYVNAGGNMYNNNIYPLSDNGPTLGTTGLRWSAVWAANGTIQTSDSNDKNFINLPYGIDDLVKVTPIMYSWKSQESLPDDDPTKNYKYYGVLANELDKIFPELVYNEQEPYQLNYSELVPVCIQAIKDLKAKCEAQDQIIETLSAKINDIESRLQK